MIINLVKNIFRKKGYSLVKNAQGYINANQIIADASKENISIHDLLEKNFDNPKKGRRERIISKMKENNCFENISTVLEIGAGTAMFLEKVIQFSKEISYEVYETDINWCDFIKRKYNNEIQNLIIRNADGISLSPTADNTINLVHSHAVFVYLPVINVYSYLKECARVVKKGGYIVFDVISDIGFNPGIANEWINQNYRFAVITPHQFIIDFSGENSLECITFFDEYYAGSTSRYYILKKI